MDYFGDEERTRALYQQFKFAVIARFAPNSDWTLNGRRVEHAITRIAANNQQACRYLSVSSGDGVL
jgi:hypothetical protein